MEKKTLLIIGLIGGILAAVGVFLSWFSTAGVSFSGWDMARTWAPLLGQSFNQPYVVLLGGILALLGGLAALLAVKVTNISYLIPLGGIIAVLGWVWAAVDIADWSAVSYGFYVCLVGGILALIGGIMGVKAK